MNLTGVAQSNARVSSLMRSLNTSTWFDNSELVEITTSEQKDTGVRLSKFILKVGQEKQKKTNEEQAGSGG